MLYKGQINLLNGLQMKDPNTYNFLSYIDKFLQAIGTSNIISSSGITVCKQNNFPKLTQGTPQFIFVSDYAHLIYWDGVTNPIFVDGGNNYYSLSDIIPSTIGWVQVAGQTIKYLLANGQLASKTLLNTSSQSAFLKATNTTPASFTAPVAAKITGNVDNQSLSPTTAKFTTNAAGTSAVTGFTDPHDHLVNTVPGTLINDTTGTPESFNSKLWFRL